MLEQKDLLFWTLTTGILSALATGLGAIPVHFVKNESKKLRSLSSAIAAGMMISASVFSLAQEGINLKTEFSYAPYVVIAGLLLGAMFFWMTSNWVDSQEFSKHAATKSLSKRSILIFISMFIHSIPEGVAIGVGFATGNFEFGLVMALAISVHNIPEGIAISLPMKSEGASTKRCAVFSIISSLPQPLMAVPAALLAWVFEPLLPIGLGFAGGAMIYLVFAELVPEAIEEGGVSLTAWGVMIGLCLMLFLTTLLEQIPGL